ncbi:MAG TPA: NAD(P)/FAD-dependent oxidoreductase [Chloroflexia bacterium]|nr:NAD(P)/FAD-dependent oxidoreductase [Chloroflexia bacterium]
MDSTERTGNGATAPDGQAHVTPNGTPADGGANDELYDLTIIGAGPTGLFAAFYAGMRTMKTKIIDALPEPGGQLMALYPEKYIYDAPGFPKIVAKDLVRNLVEQATQWNPGMVLGERVLRLEQASEGHWVLTTDKATHLSKAILIAAGVGAFAPNKLNAPGVTGLEGQAVYYFVKEKAAFAGKDLLIVGGGDSAVDWALNLQGVAKSITVIHRRNEFRAHESTVTEMMNSAATVLTPYEVREVSGDGKLEHVTIYNNKTDEEQTLHVDAILVNIGFKADIGPIREWGLQLDKRGIVVNYRMETNLPGIYAAGDIAAEEVKMNLIATGYGQAAMAVNVAKNYIDPKASIFPGHSSEKM